MANYPDLGPWLTYAEAVRSDAAARLGVANTPTPQQYANMKWLYGAVYAPLCDHFGTKLPVTSFFRNPRVNADVGGSATSAHLAGLAIDINMRRSKHPLTNNELFEYVRVHLADVFDQLIFEAPDENNVPGWVHIGLRRSGRRGEVKRMVYNETGQKVYEFWPWVGGAVAFGSLVLGLLVLGGWYWMSSTKG